MNTKLTLKLDKETIEKARIFARKKNTSLSKIVEKFFSILSEEPEFELAERSSIVGELSGIISPGEDYQIKEGYTDYLIEKYR